MRIISLLVGKTILGGLRLLGRSGSALPGLVVEKTNPAFLKTMLTGLPLGVVVVTGTNGKTTTTKVITELLDAQGLRVLTNKTGSNFVRGTVTTVIDKARFNGSLPYDIAVFEQDEAHAVHFVNQVKPRGVLALNVMRDQMDRFGEIDTTAKLIQKVVASATDWVVLNANDERVARMKPSNSVNTYWYGHSKELQSSFLTDDELHHQDKTTYTKAGDMTAELTQFSSDAVTVIVAGKRQRYLTALSGSHNAINITAALAVLTAVAPDYDNEKITAAIAHLQPAFGRGEGIKLDNGSLITLQLVKNPGGFTHALRMLQLDTYGVVGIAINDDYADGRDVSWLWDVDFDCISDKHEVFCGGTRGSDMAVRLKYDGVTTLKTEHELASFVASINKQAEDSSQNAIVFCTYTAMLKIRLQYKKYSNDIYGVSV
jgi:lipid II isoglutaminyl synthase (glutamine-hydrolysing)